MLKKLLCIFCLLNFAYTIFGQKNAGIFIGGNSSSFYRNSNEQLKFPNYSQNFNWLAGISADIIDTKRYAFKLEMAYCNKGAKETFIDNLSQNIISNVNLSYAQINVFPIVFKPYVKRKLIPYISLGGYYSYLINSKYNVKFNTGASFLNEEAKKITLKEDYGGNVSLGFLFKKIALEYRIEVGIPTILNQKETLSSIKNKSHSIILTLK